MKFVCLTNQPFATRNPRVAQYHHSTMDFKTLFQAGQWGSKHSDYLLITDHKVVMHGRNLSEILERFEERYPHKIPTIERV